MSISTLRLNISHRLTRDVNHLHDAGGRKEGRRNFLADKPKPPKLPGPPIREKVPEALFLIAKGKKTIKGCAHAHGGGTCNKPNMDERKKNQTQQRT